MKHLYTVFLGVLAATPLVIYGFPVVMIIIAGFWPTVLAFLLDRDPQLHLTACVGYMNFSGIFSQAIVMWMHEHSINYALYILSNPKAWYIMYGCSMVGFIIYVLVPSILSPVLSLWAAMRIHGLEHQQKRLLEEWDPAVKELKR